MFHKTRKPRNTKKPKSNYIWNIFKEYLCNCGLHGVGYLVSDNRHWSERLFWLIACILSWCGCGILIARSINDFISHKVEITLDTNYLNWEIEFPALHFCFYFSGIAKKYAVKVTGTDERKSNVVIRLTQWTNIGYDEGTIGNISSEQFAIWRQYIAPNCTDLFGQCLWNDEYFDCCQMFTPLETNLGQCLSFNSIYAQTSENVRSPKFVMNHRKPRATMVLYMNKTAFWNSSRDFFFLVLTPVLEFPSRSTGKDAFLTLQWNKPSPAVWDIISTPTSNDAGVMSMSYQERRCRFASEIDGFHHLKSYSYHGCILESQMQKSHTLCGCIGHVFPSSKSYRTCNSTQLRCASSHISEITNINDNHCLPNCEENTIYWFNNVSPNEQDIPDWALTKLKFNMLPGPVIRYNRYTAHSMLDVIISIGGTLGLFSGASVLSFVELLYWLLLRRGDTI